MTSAKQVFDSAIALMDDLDRDSGSPSTPANKDYIFRSPPILSILCGELFSFSAATSTSTPGVRPQCPTLVSLDDPVPLDDFLAISILPYGLAAHLLVDENPAAAAFFQQRYQELIARYGSATPVVSIPITDLYNSTFSP